MKDAARKTCLEKYGMANYINIDKQKRTVLEKSFNKYLQFSNVIPLFSLDEYSGVEYYKLYDWKCKKCGNNFKDHLYSHIPTCPICYPKYNGFSNQEKELASFIKTHYNGNIMENDRSLISPLELDIVIPEKKLAFEFNGTFWHSEQSPGFEKTKNKCLIKTTRCNEEGYKLVHIWEYDWINKNELIKEKIKALLGINQTKIYARKCIINEISSKDKNEFLNSNHIQGEDKSSIKLGLFHENELVAVMTFGKPRFNKNYEYELIRYATKSEYQVLGGAGKLLKHFERNYNPKNIITYADRFYSQGNMYRQIGFKELENTLPGYFYVNVNGIKISRYKCQKRNLQRLLGEKFHNELSEFENMTINGFYRIYDCGNYVFAKCYD
jgi:G:T-mismatch repair DNA endonuclease (very short patch repair protein)